MTKKLGTGKLPVPFMMIFRVVPQEELGNWGKTLGRAGPPAPRLMS
jgi:hypothetical protein